MFPKAHLTSHSRMSGSRWLVTASWLSGSLRSFLCRSSVYSCQTFLNIFWFCLVHTISVLYCAHLCMKCSLVSLGFLKRSLAFSILLFSSISLHWSLRNTLSVLPILWNSAFRLIYLSFSPLPFTSFLFSATCKASSDNHFAFLHFCFLGMVWSLPRVQCYKPPYIVLQALCLPDLIPWIYLLLPLYNSKEFDLGHTWMA